MVSSQTLESSTCADHKLPVSDKQEEKVGRLQRAQWLRAAILGANDGLLSTTSLMLGVGAAKEDQWSMIISGLAGALAGACSMAVGEFVSVSTQRDIEQAVLAEKYNASPEPGVLLENGGRVDMIVLHEIISNSATSTPTRNFSVVNSPSARSPMMIVMKTDARITNSVQGSKEEDVSGEDALLPNPYKAATASALAFLCGSLFPLLSAMIVKEHTSRIVVIAVVTSVALVLFGAIGAHLGGSPLRVSAARVLVGGWISMAITYSLIKPLDHITDKKEHAT